MLILLMPLIMVGQNVQGTHVEARANYDFRVNVKADERITLVLNRLKSIKGQVAASSPPGTGALGVSS